MSDALASMSNVGLSIRDVIDNQALSTPDAVYSINPATGRHMTYAQLRRSVRGVAAHIASLSIERSSCVAYALTNSPESAVVILGIMYGGYQAVAINLVAGNETVAYVLDHAATKLIIVDAHGSEVVHNALQSSSYEGKDALSAAILPINEVLEARSYDGESDNWQLSGNDDALLMYTSGTTGRPKGVVLTHSNLLAGASNTARAHELSNVDRGMCVLPMYHINGLSVTTLAPLLTGGSVVFPPRFSVSEFWETVIRCRCTWFSVVPTQVSYLVHNKATTPTPAELKSVRFGRSASAPLSPDVHLAFEKRFGIDLIETLGLTETSGQVLSNPLDKSSRKLGSPGIATGNEIAILDNTLREVERGSKVGEVAVRGANVLREYRSNPAATRDAITDEGWFRTGDLGYMDADGFVFLSGRLKELIIKGGENIAPREIDDVLYAHPDVVEAAAFSHESQRYGETVHAAVVIAEGSPLTTEDLRDICIEKLGAFKAPDHIFALEELPKGPSGKIQRFKIAPLTRSQ